MRTWLIALLTLGLLWGCKVGPNYQRPPYPTPETFRGQGPDLPAQPAGVSFGDLRWFEVFKDPKLQELITIALKENYDVQIAAQRVLAARERVTIQRSFLFPSVNAGGQMEAVRTSERGLTSGTPRYDRMVGLVTGDLSWEIDFFGRIRRATEAARAEFFASEENRRFVIQTLISDVARAYIELRALDQQLDISERTVKTREDSLTLVKARFSYGWDSLTPVLMTENLLYGARAVVPEAKRAIEQKENLLSVLIGRNPGPILRGKSLLEQDLTVTVPPGLPSSLAGAPSRYPGRGAAVGGGQRQGGGGQGPPVPQCPAYRGGGLGVRGPEEPVHRTRQLLGPPFSHCGAAPLPGRSAPGRGPPDRGPKRRADPDLQKIHSAGLPGRL